MSLRDELLATSEVPAVKGPQPGQPSVDWDGTKGTLTTGPLAEQPKSWDALIEDWGLDPAEVQVVEGSVQIRAWDANVGGGEIKRLRYYKAQLERRCATVDAEDLAEIKRALLRRKPVKGKAPSLSVGGTRIVCLADWQVGKADGDGLEGTIHRIASAIDDAVSAARGVERIVLAGMGDIIEQCSGHYPGQAFTVQLDRREQMRVARRLILRAVDAFAPIAPVDVVAVPGNHGENREGGKAFTRVSDNDDLAVFEQVADICSSTDRYPDVRFGFPPDDDPTVVTVDAGATRVAFAHGHNLDRGATGQQKATAWWKGQMAGRRPAGECDILVSGHYHHLVAHEGTGRTWFQCPAMDGGSEWWINKTGENAPPGMLSFTVGDYGPRTWGNLTLT